MSLPDKIKCRAIDLSNEGRSAGNVLKVLEKEFKDEPRLPDERTIRRWHKPNKSIHDNREQNQISQHVPKSKKELCKKLMVVANWLLANDLDNVFKGSIVERVTDSGEQTESYQIEYIVNHENDLGYVYELTSQQLSKQLKQNIDFAIEHSSESFFHGFFLPYLKNELPKELKTKDIFDIVKEQPYQLIETLRVLKFTSFYSSCLKHNGSSYIPNISDSQK